MSYLWVRLWAYDDGFVSLPHYRHRLSPFISIVVDFSISSCSSRHFLSLISISTYFSNSIFLPSNLPFSPSNTQIPLTTPSSSPLSLPYLPSTSSNFPNISSFSVLSSPILSFNKALLSSNYSQYPYNIMYIILVFMLTIVIAW